DLALEVRLERHRERARPGGGRRARRALVLVIHREHRLEREELETAQDLLLLGLEALAPKPPSGLEHLAAAPEQRVLPRTLLLPHAQLARNPLDPVLDDGEVVEHELGLERDEIARRIGLGGAEVP